MTMASQAERLASVRRVRRALAEDGPDRRKLRSADDFARVSLPHADGDVLRDLLIAERPRVVIEIGLAYAGSALAIAEALVLLDAPGAQYLIIDPYQTSFHDAGLAALSAAGLDDSFTFLRERSQLVLPRLLGEGLTADAAFVDGSHLFHHVFVDLSFLGQLVRPGGLVVLDDCQWPSVATAVSYFEVNLGWRPHLRGTPTRLRAFRLPDPAIEPAFEDFQPFGPPPAS